ncbi:DUF6541 family protein, partial [Cellulomonas septica]|nr:hypothetical protein [Cellulomonas septica]
TLVAASAVSAGVGLTALAARTSWPQPGFPALADADELDLARRLDVLLPPDAVLLGSPYSGVVNLGERAGVRVVPPTQVAPRDPDVAFVGAHVQDLGSDPRVCAALRRLGVTHLYVDTAPWNTEGAVVDLRTAPPAGVRLVDRGGSAAVYEVVGC